MVDGNNGKLNGSKFLIKDANQCNTKGGNGGQEEKMVGRSVYDDRFDGGCDVSIRKYNEYKALIKSSNGAN